MRVIERNKIKMIVTDLDDTILHKDKRISERTVSVFQRCRAAGIKVVYATGRGGSAEHLAPPELFDGKIIMNGAVARVGDEVVYSRLTPYMLVRPLLVACDRRGMKITSEVSGWHYSNFNISDEWPEMTNYSIVDFSSHDKDAEKVYSIHLTEEDVAFIENNLPDGLHLLMARDNFAQIMHEEATKAKAMASMAQKWDISPSEIVAFGDDLNDIDMLQDAGVGVAVENALPAVKAIADYICEMNDNDGVAKWIERSIIGLGR